MMRVFRSGFAIFMALGILVSSSGLVLAAHTCLTSSKTEVSLFKHHGCCAKQKKSCHEITTKETTGKCCNLKVSLHKIDVSSTFSQERSPENVITPFIQSLPFVSLPLSITCIQIGSGTSPPEPPGGIDLLISLHSLLI